jgi:hypothetical protein
LLKRKKKKKKKKPKKPKNPMRKKKHPIVVGDIQRSECTTRSAKCVFVKSLAFVRRRAVGDTKAVLHSLGWK